MRHIKKRIGSVFLILLALLLSACAQNSPAQPKSDSIARKPVIVATLFPQYDFAKSIVGGHMEVRMLLPPGLDAHAYEPAPNDIITVNSCDLFLYTGSDMEPWAQTIIEGMYSAVTTVNVIDGISLDKEDAGHAHDDDAHAYDPHVWTDPVLAKEMTMNILQAVIELDPKNEDTYRKNATAYCNALDELDLEFTNVVKNATQKPIVFGEKFAFHYFIKRYGLEYLSAYEACSHDAEPGAKVLVDIINAMKVSDIKVVYYSEMSSTKVSDTLCRETGAEKLLLHSCHNVSKSEFDEGVTYLSLMWQNAENLEKGLA